MSKETCILTTKDYTILEVLLDRHRDGDLPMRRLLRRKIDTAIVVFRDDVEFYWSRTRLLEKLNSLAGGTLPEGVQPEFLGGYDGSPWSEDSHWTIVRFRCD